MECVLTGSEVVARICVMPEKPTKTAPKSKIAEKVQGRNKERRELKTEAIIVTTQGGTYSDLLKKMKNKIDTRELGVVVKGARSTRKGELLVEIEKGQGADILQKEISKQLAEDGVMVRRGGRGDTTLHIKGMDGLTTLQEAEEAVNIAAGLPEGTIRVKALRPAYGDTQNATMTAKKEHADILMSKGRVRIGWSMVRIQERVDIQRCWRCWGTGHTARKCSGVDRMDLCMRCGQPGHKAKECQKSLYCPICEVSGHRADSLGCPETRAARSDRGEKAGRSKTNKPDLDRGKREDYHRPWANSREIEHANRYQNTQGQGR